MNTAKLAPVNLRWSAALNLLLKFIIGLTVGFSAETMAAQARLPDFASLVKRSAPAVVNISTVQKSKPRPGTTPPSLPENSPFNEYFKRYFNKKKESDEFDSQSLGAGFIISADGYIISNNHVVKNAGAVTVKLNDRREFLAQVVGADERSDIALLKIEAHDLPVAVLGRSGELRVGEWVLAIGSPFGLEHSVTVGVVSYKGRPLPQANYVPYIQTDVAINPGNSGGPLFNQAGEVVGVNSQIFSRTGGYMDMSFAIPIDVAMNVVEQLRSKGRVSRGWLGVLIQEVTGELAQTYGLTRPEGAFVAKVLDGSPAAAGGLEAGDVVVSYKGHPVKRSSDMPPIVGASPVGGAAPIVVIRKTEEGYEQLDLTVTTGELPEEVVAQGALQRKLKAPGEQPVLGAELQDLDTEQRKALGVGVQWGVLVQSLEEGPLKRAGVADGDVILTLNHADIRDSEHLAQLAQDLPPDKPLALYVLRGGTHVFLSLTISVN